MGGRRGLYRQALALDPNDPEVLHRYSLSLGYVGRIKDALAIREKLRALEPFVPTYTYNTANILRYSGQNAAAIALLEMIQVDNAVTGYFRSLYLAQAHAAEGRF